MKEIIALFLLMVLFAPAIGAEVDADSAEATSLVMAVQVENPTPTLGDPIILTMTLTAPKDGEEVALSYSYPDSLMVEVRKDRMAWRKVIWVPERSYPERKSTTIQPGQSTNEVVILLADFSPQGVRVALHEEGKYEIRLHLELEDGGILGPATCDLLLGSPPGTSSPLMQRLEEHLRHEEIVSYLALLVRAFGPRSLEMARNLSGQGIVKALETLDPSSVEEEYLMRNLLIKISFVNLLDECQKSRQWGPEVRTNTWYKKLIGAKVRSQKEYIPIMKRERQMYKAHADLLAKNLKNAETGLHTLASGTEKDYIAKKAESHLKGLRALKKKEMK